MPKLSTKATLSASLVAKRLSNQYSSGSRVVNMGLAVDELQISMSAGLGEYGGTHTGGNLAVDVVSGKTGSAKVVKEKNKDNDQMGDVFLLHGL